MSSNIIKTEHKRKKYFQRLNKNIMKKIIGQNWIVTIETSFSSLMDFPLTYVEKFLKQINFPKLRFIIYKIYLNKRTSKINITLYSEFHGNINFTEIGIKNFFSFDKKDLINVKLKCLEPKGSKNLAAIKLVIDSSKNNKDDLFWKGVPKFESKCQNEENYLFIIKNKLFEKAKEKTFLPNEFEKILQETQNHNSNYVNENENEILIQSFDMKPIDLNIEKHLKSLKTSLNYDIHLLKYKTICNNNSILKKDILDFVSELISDVIKAELKNKNFQMCYYVYKFDRTRIWKLNWKFIEKLLLYFYKETFPLKEPLTSNFLKSLHLNSMNYNSFKKRISKCNIIKQTKNLVDKYI